MKQSRPEPVFNQFPTPPLAGIRVLSMEQAVALPVGTRHLADMGAEVIRVQSHSRGAGPVTEIDLTRNKRQLALDLSVLGAAEAFLRVAAKCDVVAHNFTPRVVRKFGIDYPAVREVNPSVIYVSLTGFGTTGPWGERPLFGPGAEAVSGHNMLIGEPDGWPGRPGTIVYADTICGLNTVFAVIAALDERDRTGRGQHIDISLYETSVAQLGPVLAEAQLGAVPARVGNADANYAVHGVFDCAGVDRHVAIAASNEQAAAVAGTFNLPLPLDARTLSDALRQIPAEQAVVRLQEAGVPAHVVADASDVVTDAHLWERGYFGTVERTGDFAEGLYPHAGPGWGGGPAVPMEQSRPVGRDSMDVLTTLGGYRASEVAELIRSGATSTGPEEDVHAPMYGSPDMKVRIDRGELSRADADPSGWRQFSNAGRDS